MKRIVRLLALILAIVLCLTTLISCASNAPEEPCEPNADPDKALEALTKNEYAATKDGTVVPAALALLGVNGIDCVVSGTKVVENKDGSKKQETITVYYFASETAATGAFQTVKDYEEKNAKDKDNNDWTVAQSGKMIYAGTKAGIKAAK